MVFQGWGAATSSMDLFIVYYLNTVLFTVLYCNLTPSPKPCVTDEELLHTQTYTHTQNISIVDGERNPMILIESRSTWWTFCKILPQKIIQCYFVECRGTVPPPVPPWGIQLPNPCPGKQIILHVFPVGLSEQPTCGATTARYNLGMVLLPW